LAEVAVADGFLGRWSQRKQAVAEGKPLAEPVAVPKPPAPLRADAALPPAEKLAFTDESATPKAEPPVLSLDDVKALTPDDSYAPFVNRAVAPDVRNAAMKKLFTDPHYNVMDGLDIYIDDYSKPDPLPASMLRKMASAHFLKLFDDEDEAAKTLQPAPETVQTVVRDDATTPSDESVPESTRATLPESDPLDKQTPDALDETQKNDYLDLRLQPNHAAGPQEPGRGTE
jgi:hypothetical protein